MTIIPVSIYRPDQPALVGESSDTVKNCLARTANSYGPMPGLSALSTALGSRCQGAIGVPDHAGNDYCFAGDAADLWELASGSTTPSRVSKFSALSVAAVQAGGATYQVNDVLTLVGGTSSVAATVTVTSVSGGAITALSVTNAGNYSVIPANPVSLSGGHGTNGKTTATWIAATGYSTGADQRWSFTYYTPDRVIATNFADPVQSFVIGTSTQFADLSSGAPKARYAAPIRDFLMLFNINDSGDGFRPTRAHWSAIADATNWPTAGSGTAIQVQSDFQDLNLGDWGWGMGIVGGLGSADGALFFERGVARIAYVGAPDVFGFYPSEGVRGCPAPGSIAQLGADVIYLGPDDLYRFDGANSEPLGAEQFAKTFYTRVDQSNMFRICAAFDPINKIYFMAYPGPQNNAGNCNEVLAYNWYLKRATLIDSLGDIEFLFRSLSFGFTLDGLNNVSSSIDALQFSLDSRAWTGGALLLSAFDGSHKLNYFTGSNLAATIDSQEAQLVPGQRAFLAGLRPLLDGGTPMVAIAGREGPLAAVSYGSAVGVDSTGLSGQMSSARYHRARLTTSAGDSWTNFAGFDVPADAITPDGFS